MIRIELQLPEGALQPSKLDIVGAMQELVRTQLQGSAATVDVLDLDLTIFTGSGPIVTAQHSRGGNWLLDDGVRECTSGWSVSGPNGDGIITAGHCSGLNQFEEPRVTPYSMTYRSEVFGSAGFGSAGDVEYHTTSHVEYDDFYSDSTTIKDITGIKTTDTMVGNSVCVYGRGSDVRTCNHTVEAVGVTVNAGGTIVGNLVRVSGATTTGGDSGGGWSVSNTAWGVHHGIDGSDNAYFTPAQQAQTALGVTIKTE